MFRAAFVSVAFVALLVGGEALTPYAVTVCDDETCAANCTKVTFPHVNNPNGCDDGKQLVVGDLTFSLTKFNKEDCNRFSDRRVAYGNVGQCVPWGKDHYAIVPSLSSINAPTAAFATANVSYLPNCRKSDKMSVIQGSCNPRGSASSFIPLCLRGRVLVQYFADSRCASPSTAALQQTNDCVEPLLENDESSQFDCLGYSEATCLSIRGNPWYIVVIALLPLVSALLVACTFFAALGVLIYEQRKIPRPPATTTSAGTPFLSGPATAPSPGILAGIVAALTNIFRVTPTPTVQDVIVIGADMGAEFHATAVNRVDSYSTVSAYSTNTMRGMQTLTCFTGLTGGGLIMQAAIQQTLTDSYCRPWWLFFLQCVGYGAIVITGLVQSDAVSACDRDHNAFLCWSCSTRNKWLCQNTCTTTALTHRTSFFTYLLLPPLCMLIAFVGVESSCHDRMELVLVVLMYLFFGAFLCLWLCFGGTLAERFSFLFEMLTVATSLVLYTYYETGIMWRCALA